MFAAMLSDSPKKVNACGSKTIKHEAKNEPVRFPKPPIITIDKIKIDSLMPKLVGSMYEQ